MSLDDIYTPASIHPGSAIWAASLATWACLTRLAARLQDRASLAVALHRLTGAVKAANLERLDLYTLVELGLGLSYALELK